MTEERRRHPRIGVDAKIRVVWKSPDGRGWSEMARVIDISQSGAQIACARPIPERSYLHVESKALRIVGMSQVRHCEPVGLGWRVGVEFAGGLQWRRPQPGSSGEAQLPLRKAAGAGH